LSAAAGPVTNLVLSLVFALIFKLSMSMSGGQPQITAQFLAACMVLNIILAVFNLLPVPPLDGSHVLAALLPRTLREAYESLRPFGWVILILALTVPGPKDAIRWVVVKTLVYTLVALRIDLGLLPSTNPLDLLKGGG
jgi:Zn-dependent protease